MNTPYIFHVYLIKLYPNFQDYEILTWNHESIRPLDAFKLDITTK